MSDLQFPAKRARLADENLNLIRKRCEIYNSVNDMKKSEDDPLFTKNFNETSSIVIMNYKNYFDELSKYENSLFDLEKEKLLVAEKERAQKIARLEHDRAQKIAF